MKFALYGALFWGAILAFGFGMARLTDPLLPDLDPASEARIALIAVVMGGFVAYDVIGRLTSQIDSLTKRIAQLEEKLRQR